MTYREFIIASITGIICLWIGLECGHKVGERQGYRRGNAMAAFLAQTCPNGLVCNNCAANEEVTCKPKGVS